MPSNPASATVGDGSTVVRIFQSAAGSGVAMSSGEHQRFDDLERALRVARRLATSLSHAQTLD